MAESKTDKLPSSSNGNYDWIKRVQSMHFKKTHIPRAPHTQSISPPDLLSVSGPTAGSSREPGPGSTKPDNAKVDK